MMEFLKDIPPSLYALIGTIVGGVGLKLIEHWLNRDVQVIAERRDYRDEITELRDRLDKVEAEVDEWRDRYYHNEEEIHTLRAFIIGMGKEPPARNPLPPKP